MCESSIIVHFSVGEDSFNVTSHHKILQDVLQIIILGVGSNTNSETSNVPVISM